MWQQWLKALQAGGEQQSAPEPRWLERVTAMLLVEIARADHEIDTTELASIRKTLQASCPSIDAQELDSIIAAAQSSAEVSISFHEHVRQINDGFSREQKLRLVEQMWRVAYADGDLDKYEEYTIRKLADLIYVEHAEFIKAKLRVLDALN